MNIIGNNVKKIRERNGRTQDQLAEKCNLLEWNISRSTLAKIESKVRRVTDIEVKLFTIALNTEYKCLFD
ncbi:MAG: helix-turn-helix transcriptional regulator [Gammaproteobacteria bacterium]|nr:helix-turn-helix transcriptional regulator [Gammaproteobacteria bacterium]